MNTVVLDASILLKWVLPETEEDFIAQANDIGAAALTGRVCLLVPSLWYYEVGNIVARHIPDHASAAMNHLSSLLAPWTRAPTPEVQTLTLDLMRSHGVTFYDASYHALAIASRGVLITADALYVRKVGVGDNLMALADWPPHGSA